MIATVSAAETMSLQWIHENPPHWDEAKAEIVGGAPAGSLDAPAFARGEVIPGEWWRVEEDGKILGYGWMDTVMWGDAEILLAVAPSAGRRGVGTFILDRLESEAAARGLRYMYNVVRPSHPHRAEVTRWLRARGFEKSHDDERLMRRVRSG